jgi:predicted metal-dependent hydrolase
VLIKKILTDETTPYIKQRFDLWSKKMKLNPKLLFKWMTTRWGVCNIRECKVTLALQLGANSKAAIDYVIVHELSHLYRPDHSVHFWEFVASYIPNWKQLRDEINLKLK